MTKDFSDMTDRSLKLGVKVRSGASKVRSRQRVDKFDRLADHYSGVDPKERGGSDVECF